MQANLRTKCFLNLLCQLFFSNHQYFCTLLYQQLVHQLMDLNKHWIFHVIIVLVVAVMIMTVTIVISTTYCLSNLLVSLFGCFPCTIHIVSLAASPIVSATCVAFLTPSLAVSATNCFAPTLAYSSGSRPCLVR